MSACKPVGREALDAIVERARTATGDMQRWGFPDRAYGGWVIVNNHRPQGFTPGGLSLYKVTAWDKPVTAPLLPWSEPVGHRLGRVEVDGTYTPLCEACQPV